MKEIELVVCDIEFGEQRPVPVVPVPEPAIESNSEQYVLERNSPDYGPDPIAKKPERIKKITLAIVLGLVILVIIKDVAEAFALTFHAR